MVQADKKCSKKLLDRMRESIRLKHYSIRTEEDCVAWTKRHRQKQSSAQGVPKNVPQIF
jgi:hypothetical protein